MEKARDRLRVKVLKGLAGNTELAQLEVEKDSLVLELMVTIHQDFKVHWRRQRLVLDGQPLEECQTWAQITEDEVLEVCMVHCDHRQLEPIANRETLLTMLRYTKGEALRFGSAELKADREVVHMAVERSAKALQFASKALQGDLRLVQLAMSQDPTAFRSAGRLAQQDPVVAKRAIDADPDLMKFCHPDLYANKRFMKQCVQRDASLLRYATCKLDREMYEAALQQDGKQLDRELCVAALQQDGLLLEWMPSRDAGPGCDDTHLVLLAVMQNGMALEFATDRLQNDVQLALEAVARDARAIQFVKKKSVICQLVKEHPDALKHVANPWRDDMDVVQMAYNSDPQSLIHVFEPQVAMKMLQTYGAKVYGLLAPAVQGEQRVLLTVLDVALEEVQELTSRPTAPEAETAETAERHGA